MTVVDAGAIPTEKACTKCGETKPLEEFYKEKGGRFGRKGRCIVCYRAIGDAWKKKNVEAISMKQRDYFARQPHLLWANAYRARARRGGFEPVVEEFTRDDVIARYGDGCYHCDSGAFEELDHHPIPVAEGGPHTLGNVKPSCQACNIGVTPWGDDPEEEHRRAVNRVKDYRRRVRAYGFEPVDEVITREMVIERYGDACWHCGGPFRELDHFPVEVRDGGSHTLDNVRPACRPCNNPNRAERAERVAREAERWEDR